MFKEQEHLGERLMYDPIPWYLDGREAQRRGLGAQGWYIMDGKKPIIGPCGSPEDCILMISDRNQVERSAVRRSRPALGE